MRAAWLGIGAALAGFALLPSGAGAVGTGTVDSIRLPGAANSVTLAADGSVWTSLYTRRTVARIAPDGTVTESDDLQGPTSGITFAEGKVWVAVPSQKKVFRFDPSTASASQITSTPPASCGPVAIAGLGNGQVYASLPNTGTDPTCAAAAHAVLPISAAGVAASPITGRGQAFDLVTAGGALWVPDSEGDVLRRVLPDASLTVAGSFTLPAASGATGVGVAADGTIAVGLASSGSVARVSPTAATGSAAEVFATGISSPAGVAGAHGSLFVAGSALSGGSPTIRRFPGDGSLALPITPLAASQPWDVSPGPDGTVLFTDLANERLLRFTSRPPRASTGAATPGGGTLTTVDLTVNPGGNAAVTTVEFGPTTAYGSTAVAVPTTPGVLVAGGTADVALRAELKDLAAATTYHYRAVVVSPEGTAYGEDRTFTTGQQVVAPRATKRPKIVLTRSTKRGVLKVSKIRVTGLTGGERITVSCAGKGCPTKKKDRTIKTTAKQAGSLTVSAKKITSAKLGKGAKVTVQVTKAGSTGVVATARVVKKKLTLKDQCIAPGAKKPGAC